MGVALSMATVIGCHSLVKVSIVPASPTTVVHPSHVSVTRLSHVSIVPPSYRSVAPPSHRSVARPSTAFVVHLSWNVFCPSVILVSCPSVTHVCCPAIICSKCCLSIIWVKHWRVNGSWVNVSNFDFFKNLKFTKENESLTHYLKESCDLLSVSGFVFIVALRLWRIWSIYLLWLPPRWHYFLHMYSVDWCHVFPYQQLSACALGCS